MVVCWVTVGGASNLRKAKRVSDVAAMGSPTAPPTFNPGTPYNPGFQPAGPPPPYQEGIQLDNQDYAPVPPAGSEYTFLKLICTC